MQDVTKICVDIILPIYNGYDDLKLCLNSVFKYTNFQKHRLILINDNSPDKRIKKLLNSIKKNNVIIIHNQTNKGFSNNVNTGFSLSNSRDVILLNSDTIVTANWIDKIVACAYSKKEIGTVTPLSNNATLASVPIFCAKNEVPENLSIDGMAKLIEHCSIRNYPRISVAVGFCMFIKRIVIKDVGKFDAKTFGRGYGEENDFCNRAEQAGYIHTLCDDTFIYHKGTTSFMSEEKMKLKKEHNLILQERYPEQMRINRLYCFYNPHQYIRDNILVHLTLHNGRKNILYFCDAFPCKNTSLLKRLKNNYNVFMLWRQNDLLNLTIYTQTISYNYNFSIHKRHLYFPFSDTTLTEYLTAILDGFNISLIHIQNILDFSLDIFNLAKARKIPVIYTMHDLFCIPPIDRCINKSENKEYSYSVFSNINKLWKQKFESALKYALVVFLSKDIKAVVSSYYKNIKNMKLIRSKNTEEIISDYKTLYNKQKTPARDFVAHNAKLLLQGLQINGKKAFDKDCSSDFLKRLENDIAFISTIKKYNNIYIYGAGHFGIACCKRLKGNGIKPKAFLVTNTDGNPQNIEDIPVIKFPKVKINKKNSIVIIALKRDFIEQVKPTLDKRKIFSICFLP